MPLLVIGYGNPDRGDDAVAWHIINQLHDSDSGLVAFWQHQLVPELAESFAQAHEVVIIDAQLGPPPGTVQLVSLRSCRPANLTPALSHHCDPAMLYLYARNLYDFAGIGYLLTVAGDCFDAGAGLSDPVVKAIPTAVAMVLEIAGRFRSL